MAEFSYIIRNKNGIRETGDLKASNYNEAMLQLQNDGSTVIKLNEKDTSFDFIKPFTDRLYLEIEKFKNRIPLSVLVFFTI